MTESPPWTTVGESGQVTGTEAVLVQALAEELGCQVEWHPGSESEIFEALEHFRLDLAVGGLERSTPWEKRLGLTRTYVTVGDREHVLAVPPGENGWLLRIDRFLAERGSAFVPATQEDVR